jgi:hypothetical protein
MSYKKANEKANELQAVADLLCQAFIGELESVGTTLNTFFKNATRGAAQAHSRLCAYAQANICLQDDQRPKMTSILKILLFCIKS